MSGSDREDFTRCASEASSKVLDISLAFKDQETGI